MAHGCYGKTTNVFLLSSNSWNSLGLRLQKMVWNGKVGQVLAHYKVTQTFENGFNSINCKQIDFVEIRCKLNFRYC